MNSQRTPGSTRRNSGGCTRAEVVAVLKRAPQTLKAIAEAVHVSPETARDVLLNMPNRAERTSEGWRLRNHMARVRERVTKADIVALLKERGTCNHHQIALALNKSRKVIAWHLRDMMSEAAPRVVRVSEGVPGVPARWRAA